MSGTMGDFMRTSRIKAIQRLKFFSRQYMDLIWNRTIKIPIDIVNISLHFFLKGI